MWQIQSQVFYTLHLKYQPPKMKQRTLGKTGLTVPVLGFGAMRLPEKDQKVERKASMALIRRAIELGINYIDTAPAYCRNLSEEIVGRAIVGFDRDSLIVSTKNDERKDADRWWEHLHTSLKRLATDYIDIYFFWGIKGREFAEGIAPPGLYEEAVKAKEQGLIRHIAFSFHDEPKEITPIIDSGLFEVMLVQYSLMDRILETAIKRAHSRGMGVVVMGPLGGGRITQPSPIMELLAPTPMGRANVGLRFALSHPGVSAVLSGMSDVEMLEENVDTANKLPPLTSGERERIEYLWKERERQTEIGCTSCRYCEPCPRKVNIPFVLSSLEAGLTWGLWDYAKERISFLRGRPDLGEDMSACDLCGECDEKCPQGIAVSKLMREAKERLSE